MNISAKSLLILIFLCIFAAKINDKRNLNMKKLDIKRALSERNMTQVELYQKIGMSPQAICMIIKNNNPTVAKLMQIAEGIGCDITDLFYPDPAEEAEEQKKKELEINMKPLGMGVMEKIAGRVPDVMGGNREGGVDWANIDETSDGIAGNGGEMEEGKAVQTSTFCPHCGKKVRVGVILLPEEC